MKWENFKHQFHESWHPKMQPFIESEECDKIYAFLKSESKRGKKIAPMSASVFRCFKETPYDNVKVVMMGLCPYHTMKQGVYVADGLLMGCSITKELQPSLLKFYEGVEKDVYDGLNLNYFRTPDVSYLSQQGVLMVNAALTTEINKAGSHLALWQPFTKYLLEHVLNVTGVPYIFLGKEAARYQSYLPPFTWSFVASHPASAAYKNTSWDTEKTFSKVNEVLKGMNNTTIQWLCEEPPF